MSLFKSQSQESNAEFKKKVAALSSGLAKAVVYCKSEGQCENKMVARDDVSGERVRQCHLNGFCFQQSSERQIAKVILVSPGQKRFT
jgi:hypothetical protein